MDFCKPKALVAITSALMLLTIVMVVCSNGDQIDYYYEKGTVGWGMNKTVGWGWDLYSFAPFFCFIILLSSLLGYTILWISRLHLNRLVSIFNLITLLVLVAVSSLHNWLNSAWSIILLGTFLSILLFLTNTIFAIQYKISDKKGNQKL